MSRCISILAAATVVLLPASSNAQTGAGPNPDAVTGTVEGKHVRVRVVACHNGEGGTLAPLSQDDCNFIAERLAPTPHESPDPNDLNAFEAQRTLAGLGLPAPSSVKLLDFPKEIVDRIPAMVDRAYFINEDDVMVVDKKTRVVVSQIDVNTGTR